MDTDEPKYIRVKRPQARRLYTCASCGTNTPPVFGPKASTFFVCIRSLLGLKTNENVLTCPKCNKVIKT